jgi:hypothetical protein
MAVQDYRWPWKNKGLQTLQPRSSEDSYVLPCTLNVAPKKNITRPRIVTSNRRIQEVLATHKAAKAPRTTAHATGQATTHCQEALAVFAGCCHSGRRKNPCWDDVQQQSEMLRRIRIRWQQKRWPRETPFERLAMLDCVTNNVVLNERRSPSNWRFLFAQDYIPASFSFFFFLSIESSSVSALVSTPTYYLTMSAPKAYSTFQRASAPRSSRTSRSDVVKKATKL